MQSSSRAEAPPDEELRRKLTWLTVFRTVATTLLLGVSAVRLLTGPVSEPASEDIMSFVLVGTVYVLTLIYGLVLRHGRVGPAAAYVQVLGDVVLASCLVYLTGGAESPFTFTYSIAVVAASILLFERGALLAATVSSLAYALLLLLLEAGLLRYPEGTGALPPLRLGFLLGSHVLAQYLIAALAGYLSRQLYTAGGRLSATTADLQQLATLQRQILACMPSGLITCSADGRITFVNPAGQALLGLESSDVVGLPLEEVLPGAHALGAHARRRELVVPTSEGPRTLGLAITPLEGSDNGALLIVFQDLTDLRRMEAALKRADALATLGTLSAQLAHEIRNPLASMRGSAQMLAGDSARDPATRRLTGILVREADRLSRLVEDFLRFARPPTPQRQRVALDELVRATLEMLQADPLAAQVQISLSASGLIAEVDPDQLQQVLLNLLRNALQAASPAGEVRVELRQEGGEILLRIWDSAGSIPARDLARIFEPFVTTRPGGTGLGLSTAHAIVQAHGGIIQVTSSPQQGTAFTVHLPLLHLEAVGAHPHR